MALYCSGCQSTACKHIAKAKSQMPKKQESLQMNDYCHCDYCNHGDMPIDDEMTLEMRIDIAEAALSGIRQHLWKLDHKLNDLIEWNKRLDIGLNIQRIRNENYEG